ncbi:tubulinyl-Tyr carboxypeptidase 1 isoform X2 [Microtus oregoni]|uniref:tubulinyl-Tyr carboxypeptidase 1 isoform X2 n=1 Tax=Microtus oregoni TaxID=111838 RepID=UPI001BB26304|nr:tubulinyl-Tyr carboxypeptidase 1 isoform X2 [Microtus oregoni]
MQPPPALLLLLPPPPTLALNVWRPAKGPQHRETRNQRRKGKRTYEMEVSLSSSTEVDCQWTKPPGKGCGSMWPRSTRMERRWPCGSVGPRTFPRLMDLAKEMTKEALPIKCLEAVILGIYLTNSMPTLERFPISFKTYFSGNYFRHIVLGVNFGGRYGALGMSRREDLMYKPPAFRTLSELVLDYEAAYGRCWHVLKKVKLGQCVSHDPHSVEQIEWKHSVLDVERLGREDFRKELERHARDMRLKIGKGTGPPSPTKDRKKDVSSPQRAQSSPHRRNSRSERRPSGEKKPAEPKAMPDLNGYQIRV